MTKKTNEPKNHFIIAGIDANGYKEFVYNSYNEFLSKRTLKELENSNDDRYVRYVMVKRKLETK